MSSLTSKAIFLESFISEQRARLKKNINMTETKEKEKVTLRSNPGQFIKNGLKGIAHFIWNPTEKMFINRTFLSWGNTF